MEMSSEMLYMGWLPDLPDFRDYTMESPPVEPALARVNVSAAAPSAPPPAVDLRSWCSAVENQLNLGACTAHAGVGLIEYFECRAFGKCIDASRLFLYKVTRELMHLTGDTGATLRATMKAMTIFGVPPEEYWRYQVPQFDTEPTPFLYSFAQNYQAIQYYRLDPPGTPRDLLLNRIKALLAAGLPSMFGFTVYSSIQQAATSGKIPRPTPGEAVLGGHAIDAVGYDDNMKIKNATAGSTETTGALLIRNSWGDKWGDKGYGWLPYDYVLSGLAVDWWSLIKNEWLDTNKFA